MTDTNTKEMTTGRNYLVSLVRWFDADYATEDFATAFAKPDKVEWTRVLPFILLHAGCLGVFLAGWNWTAAGAAVFFYLLRMFAITGFYHRYF